MQIKFDYAEANNLAVGDVVYSEDFSAGGYRWRVECYPRGYDDDDKGEYLSIYLELLSTSNYDVRAILQAFLMGKDESLLFSSSNPDFVWGWPRFGKRSDLESLYLVDGWVTIMCRVIGVRECGDRPLAVPPSDIGDHLGRLLTAADGSDVSFVVDGKTFFAHRAVLAARSPVFKAELFGSMAEPTMSSITLQDIDPATFQVLLRFMYTDVLPDDGELGDDDGSPIEMYKNLLAAADRCAMDRLKKMCASKLWDVVSVDTVADILACAETYNCPELKEKCLGFLIDDKNFKKAVLTDGFVKLVHKFPSFIAELREKAGTS